MKKTFLLSLLALFLSLVGVKAENPPTISPADGLATWYHSKFDRAVNSSNYLYDQGVGKMLLEIPAKEADIVEAEKASLIITSNDAVDKKIALGGKGLDTAIGDNLILVSSSDISNEHWYYIESGHSSKTVPNNADGRFGGLITSSGSSVRADGDLIHPSGDDRKSQKWKVVAVQDKADTYYLINQNGEYFYHATDKKYYTSTTTVGDTAQFTLGLVVGTKYVSLKDQKSNLYVGALNGGNVWGYEDNNTAPAKQAISGTDYGLAPSPRAFRFVPEADIDGFYPTIYPQSTAVGAVTKWSYIKSLDPVNAATPYLTLNEAGDGFELKAKVVGDDKQLFGFINDGKTTGAANVGGQATAIVSKADPTKYLTTTATVGAASKWYMEHVVAPNLSTQVQGTLRATRNGSFLVASGGGIAIQATNSNNGNIGDNASEATYSSKYNWAYEKDKYEVKVTQGANIASITHTAGEFVSGTTFDVNNSATLTITYTLDDENSVPAVLVNGLPNTTSVQDAENHKQYTLSLVITEATEIAISASEPVVVSVAYNEDAASHIALVSPSDAGTYSVAKDAQFVLTFTAEGYTPAVEGAVLTGPDGNGVYTATIASVAESTIITISATLITSDISIAAGAGIANLNTTGIPAKVDYFSTLGNFTFKLAAGYHLPKLIVNGKYSSEFSKEGDVYTVALTGNVHEAKDIYIEAYADNTVPAIYDLVSGALNTTGTTLAIEQSTYVDNVAYLKFDLSTVPTDYDTLKVKLAISSAPTVAEVLPLQWVKNYQATAGVAPSSDILWTESNFAVATQPEVNGEIATINIDPSLTESLEWVIDNAATIANIKAAVAAATEEGDKALSVLLATPTKKPTAPTAVAFVSREGAAVAKDLSLTPVLSFSKADATTKLNTPDANDPVVTIKYYNLLGQPVGDDLSVSPTGVYIELKNHASGKVTTTKRFIPKK
ncbi:hypothetical protein EZS27_000710 [termite gut metagenome]|uniref:Uncharacterized protein n=1 Tax=termite gut metagenome TaxID=433724 RepID=A0A5J4T2M4_9ZZZZ